MNVCHYHMEVKFPVQLPWGLVSISNYMGWWDKKVMYLRERPTNGLYEPRSHWFVDRHCRMFRFCRNWSNRSHTAVYSFNPTVLTIFTGDVLMDGHLYWLGYNLANFGHWSHLANATVNCQTSVWHIPEVDLAINCSIKEEKKIERAEPD